MSAAGTGFLSALGRVLLPPRCLVCGQAGERGRDLCGDCHRELPWNRSACARCALPLPRPAPRCGRCGPAPPPFQATRAVFLYAPPLDRLLPRLKFHADLAAGRLLSQLMADTLAGSPRPEALLPLPLHPGRLRERGYDQALELARPLARTLALPLRDDLLVRRRATAPQSRLDAADRRRNLRGAFALREGAVPPGHVALLDDVMTTGSTVAEAARALRRAGVACVQVWVVARAPPPGQARA